MLTKERVWVCMVGRVYLCLSEWHQSLWAYTCLFTNSCSVKNASHTQKQKTPTYKQVIRRGESQLLNTIPIFGRWGNFYTHPHTHSMLITAASSIFSVFLIIWSVDPRPCGFHGSLLLIKINSIQLRMGRGLLLYNWIWVDNESGVEFQHLISAETNGGLPAAAAN